MKIEYERITTEVTIKPKGEPIFHELATKVRIDDEAGGPFLRISQVRDERNQEITVDIESWPSLRDGIEDMMANCTAMGLRADPVNRMANQEEGAP